MATTTSIVGAVSHTIFNNFLADATDDFIYGGKITITRTI